MGNRHKLEQENTIVHVTIGRRQAGIVEFDPASPVTKRAARYRLTDASRKRLLRLLHPWAFVGFRRVSECPVYEYPRSKRKKTIKEGR